LERKGSERVREDGENMRTAPARIKRKPKMEQQLPAAEVCKSGCPFYKYVVYPRVKGCHYLLYTGKRRSCELGCCSLEERKKEFEGCKGRIPDFNTALICDKGGEQMA